MNEVLKDKEETDVSDGEYQPADFALRRIRKEIEQCEVSEAIAFHTRARMKDKTEDSSETVEFQEFLASLMIKASENWMEEEQQNTEVKLISEERKEIDTLTHECRAPSMRAVYPLRFDGKRIVRSDQREMIANQWKMMIQLTLIVRLASVDRSDQTEAHKMSVEILRRINQLALKTENIRQITREFDSIFVAVPPPMNNQKLRDLAMGNTEEIEQNGWNTQWFPEKNTLLGFCGLHPVKKPHLRRGFTQTELKLLKRGLLEVTTFVEQVSTVSSETSIKRGTPTLMSGDWLKLQKRFLPHRKVIALENKVSRLRASMDPGYGADFRSEFRQRKQVSSELTEEQLSVLCTGVRMFGTHSWSRIAHHFALPLHSISVAQLRKHWMLTGQPRKNRALQKAKKRHNTAFFDPSCSQDTSHLYSCFVSELTDSDAQLFKSLLEESDS